ncbi:MAG: hypothetical protein ACK5Q5_17155 [Planctomycetaceae bacterium]
MSNASAAPEIYVGPGLQFRYPSGWAVEEERTEDQFTVSVFPNEDDGTTSWSVSLLLDRPAPTAALRAALQAFEEAYEDLDAYISEERVSGRKTIGRDLEFICFELTNTAGIRVTRTRDFTALVLFQATDDDLESVRDSFRMLTGSLQFGWGGGEEE